MSYEASDLSTTLADFFNGVVIKEQQQDTTGCCESGCLDEVVYFDSNNFGYCLRHQGEDID